MSYTFIFVCQQSELEIKAALLAASLKENLQGKYELIAAIPSPPERWNTPTVETLQFLQNLGVKCVSIRNEIADDYPIGNKITALSILTTTEKTIFLDSDLLLLKAWNPRSRLAFSAFCAKPADLDTFKQDIKTWEAVYHLFNLPFPTQRMVSTVSRQIMLPYFNAGFISIQNGLNFPETWLDSCQKIEAASQIDNKRPWLDQIGLPITAARLGIQFDCLDEGYNYPVHLKPLGKNLPYFVHYHRAECLRREPRLRDAVCRLVIQYPTLKIILSRHEEWEKLLKPYQLSTQSFKKSWWMPRLSRAMNPPSPEAFITGIPRSGTSYLCRLLHQLPDCVVLNEPSQIFPALLNNGLPYGVPLFYQEVRRKILEGECVENKIKDGELIEDTAIEDMRSQYYPQVSRPDFILITKNTLAYLARIPHIRTVMPEAPLIACIRHPLDTLASWKTTFTHLKTATLDNIPVGHIHDPSLSLLQRQCLQEIANTSDEAMRRALWWRYLAETILDNKWQLHIVKYEDLVLSPNQTVTQVLQAIPHANNILKLPIKHLKPSALRHKREALANEEIEMIWAICGQVAAEFGYIRT